MRAEFEQLLDHARGIWRYRRAAMLIAWSVAILGWLVVLALPDTYQGQARLYVDTSTALRPLLQGLAVDQDIEAQLSLVRETLLGRPQLEKVARDADLDLKVETATDRDELIEELRKAISIDTAAPSGVNRDRRGSDSIYTITYEDRDRDRSLVVVRSLLNTLVEDTLGGKRSGANTAQNFLRDQIADYEARLSLAESSLADFKKRNVGLVPGEQGDYFSRLQGEVMAANRSRSALDVALRRRAELERQLQGEQALVPGAGGAARASGRGNADALGGGDTATRVAEAQARLDDLLLRFTDRHPDVIAAREILDRLKVRQQTELESLRRGDPSAAANSGLISNPVYQSIQLQRNEVDVEIAALRGELAEHDRAVAQLRKLLNTAPEVEAEFSRLNRDYDVTKAQYNALLDRLEKAKLSDDAQQTGIVQFEIIDPPMVDLEPIKPNRPILLTSVLVAAFIAAIAVAWLLAQLTPVFTDTRSLEDLTGLPVLGAVTMMLAERAQQEFHRSMRQVAGTSAALVALFLVVLLLHQKGARVLHMLIPLS